MIIRDGTVKNKGNLILAGAKIVIPRVQTLAPQCTLPKSLARLRVPKHVQSAAQGCTYPTLIRTIEGKKSPSVTYSLSNKLGNKVLKSKVHVTTQMDGELRAGCVGALPVGFDIKKMEAEVSSISKELSTSISFKKFSATSVTVKSDIAKTDWTGSVKINSDLSVELKFSPKSMSFTRKGVVFEGNIGLTIHMKFEIEWRDAPRLVAQALAIMIDEYGLAIVVVIGIILFAAVIFSGGQIAVPLLPAVSAKSALLIPYAIAVTRLAPAFQSMAR